MDTLLLEGCPKSVYTASKFTSEVHPSFLVPQNNSFHSNHDDLDRFRFLDSDIHTNIAAHNQSLHSEVIPDGQTDETVAPDDFPDDESLRYISEILMEEDLDNQTVVLHDYAALEATEKSLYDVLGEAHTSSSDTYPTFSSQSTDFSDGFLYQSCNSQRTNHHAISESLVSSSLSSKSDSLSYGSFSDVVKGLVDSPASTLLGLEFEDEAEFDWLKEASKFSDSGCNSSDLEDGFLVNQRRRANNEENYAVTEGGMVENVSRGRKNLARDDTDHEEGRRNKHLASFDDEYVEMEQYDDVLLCKGEEECKANMNAEVSGASKHSKQKKVRSKMSSGEGQQLVDLRTILTHCAQAVANFDLRNANELLSQIRIHSSQFGDSTQRMAHYLANALEARLSGTGWQQCRDFGNKRISSAEILKAYRVNVSAIPFRRVSYCVATDAISKMAENATRIHIIDFGIFFGFQWPDLIQKLSKRKQGPPMLRITGIDYPERGFRPAFRVEETGRRLAGYCERFKVPFEYQAIAKDWDAVTAEEIHTRNDELIVVNCLYMARKLLDETVDDENNPRDSFLRLIRELKPDMFIHGIVNGKYGAPYFLTRFKEALYHYSAVFDMFEATVPRESNERLLFESCVYGKDALNALACEGTERVERPETYRQWQVRIQRAGFRKLPLDYELLKKVKVGVKGYYHKDFVVDENSHWMLQGWKGRILYALSCWTSA